MKTFGKLRFPHARTLAVAALASAMLSQGVGYASATTPASNDSRQIPLRAAVYNAVSGEAVDLTGRLHAVTRTSGSDAEGWTVNFKANLDNVTGVGRTAGSRYRATGADGASVQLPAGSPTRTASFKPVFTLHPPSPIKPQQFTLMVIASLSDTGQVTGLEVRSPAPPLAFSTDATVVPAVASLPGAAGQPARPVARLVDALGNSMDFVADELSLSTDDPSVVQGFLDRWRGQEVRTIQPTPGSSNATVHVVRVDASTADLSALKANVTRLDPTAYGAHRTSTDAALRLFAAAVSEKAAGRHVALNTLYTPTDYVSRVTTEAPDGDNDPATKTKYTRNAADWSYMKAGGPENFGVTEAWRMLAVGGRMENRVKIGIIDVGCASSNVDFPTGTTGGNNVPGVKSPWHCTNVAVVAGGVPDNGAGTAGTGGPVAELRLYPTDMSDDDAAARVYDAINDQVKIINMSFGGDYPSISDLLDSDLEDAIEAAHDRGILVFAAAGNAKPEENVVAQDVDHQTCYFVCVESALMRPCEFADVVCVGGLRSGTHDRDPGSFYCFDRRDEGICDVDLYAPFTVYTGIQPLSSRNYAATGQGTSYSSPYAAGVAALIWAANPGLSNVAIEGILSNGQPTSDRTVTAVIDARAAVLRAFGGNVPPSVRVTAPTDGATVNYGGLNAVRFSAESLDVEQGANAVDLSWVSDVDGRLGDGPSIDYVFPTTGRRRITVTAKDRSGATGTASIAINAINAEPRVAIVSPWEGQEFYVGATYNFTGEVSDQINAPEPSLCGGLQWTSDVFKDAPFPTTGCGPSITFKTRGPRTITASYTDSEGATGTDTVDIYVADQPANSPPVVVIENPTNGQSFAEGATIPLRASVYLEPGESSPVEYAWYLNGVLIDEAMNLDFKPSDRGYVNGNSVLTFGARDDDGYASTSINIYIAARPK